MDNNELDKILKEKLKNKITPSKEFEQKIQNMIKEQKAKAQVQAETNNSKTLNLNMYNRMKFIVSIAAVALIALMIGISFRDGINFEEKTITIATIKEIKPTKASNEVLASDSEFLIYTQGEDLTVESVQKSLYIEPALEYTINKTNNENEYKLTFKQNIPNNTIVKLQYVKDKITQDSWAYQTSTELSVNSTYPFNDETNVSKNTVIEIEFSYASIEELEEYVEISPSTKGKWEHLGKVWRFIPEKELLDGKYNVKVKKGITAQQKTLKDDYTFSFSVGKSIGTEYYFNTISIDGINTYRPDEAVKIYCREIFDNQKKLNISKIEIAKFESKEDFVQYLEKQNYDKATNLGEYEFKQTTEYVEFINKLQTGYYAAIIYGTNGAEIFNCPIQINELSAYAIETERDVLVWVANGENLAKDIQVTYQGKVEKTDSKGLAEFTDIADDSETIKYLEIGNTINKVIVGIYNYDTDNYPNAYLYTDRPLYKNTDTINIWGFVPRDLFYDEIEEEFYIELNSEGKQKVKVDEEGNINYSIELKNHMDEEDSEITLYYKDTVLASRLIAIENYEAQNYTYEVIYNKNYAYAGTKFEFDVKIAHITGLTVPNKLVMVEYKDEVYRIRSGEDGIAHFSIEILENEELSSNPSYESISIYNGDGEEYTNRIDSISIYEINKDVYTNIKENNNSYIATLYKLADDKKVIVDNELKELYNGVYNTSVCVELEENVWTRYISEYTYNEYTKENEPEYLYEKTQTNLRIINTLETKNGQIEINASELPLKEETDEVHYDYNLIFTYYDQEGRSIEDIKYGIDDKYEEEYETNGLGYYYVDGNDLLGTIDTKYVLDRCSYYKYRYFLKGQVNKFSIGDTVNFTLAESTETGIKDITNSGEILRVVFQEDITQKEVIENSDFSYKFTKEDFPGCKITTAYFYKGKFYRMPIYYFDFNEEERNVDIEIVADKDEYKPGDQVTLTVKATNNGKPIKTSVNISVVNEAVFALEDDVTNLIEEIYWNKAYPVYTFSTYCDYIYKVERRRWWRRR